MKQRQQRQWKQWMAGVFVCGMASVATAATAGPATELQEVRDQVAALKAEVAQLRGQQSDTWLNDHRRAELKSLVRDVLSDADTRASLLKDTMASGYDGHHFYLSSADGKFKLGVEGQFDLRYIYNKTQQAPANGDENIHGFQLRRAKLGFFGNIYGKELTYKIKGAFDRSSGNFQLEDGWIDYNFGNGLDIKAGQFTTPFLREYMISSSALQAVERTMVTQYFGGEFTQGIALTYKTDKWRVIGMLSAGPGKRNTDFNNNTYEYALIGRGEFLVAGNWKQFDDFQNWSGESAGLLLGGAMQYAAGASGVASKADLIKYTVDASAKLGNGINLYGAFVGQHVNNRGDNSIMESSGDQYGFIAQAGAFVIPDKVDLFARYEYANLQGVAVSNGSANTSAQDNNALSMLTLGGNYYLHKHNAKFTLDGVYAFKPVASAFAGAGSGILPDLERGQFALRAQVQLKF